MSNTGVAVSVIGFVAILVVVPVMYYASSSVNNALNTPPQSQGLQQSEQSTLHTLEANGGSAISMDPSTLLDAGVAVLAAMAAVFGLLFLKDR
jgi:hypothetical protein